MNSATTTTQETSQIQGKSRRFSRRFTHRDSLTHLDSSTTLKTLADHAEMLLAVAKRYSACTDDAYDAYQRGVEIFLRNTDRLDPDNVTGWLCTVVKHEALAITRQRQRQFPADETHSSLAIATTGSTPEDQLLDYEYVQDAATALRSLKPQERQALWLQAQGNSYREIAEITGWTYTKVNRCITEGRKSLFGSYKEILAGERCQKTISLIHQTEINELEAKNSQLVQEHLAHCMSCRARARQLQQERLAIAILFPLIPLKTKTLWAALYQFVTQPFFSGWERLTALVINRWENLQLSSGLRGIAAVLLAATLGATGYSLVDKLNPHQLQQNISQAASPKAESTKKEAEKLLYVNFNTKPPYLEQSSSEKDRGHQIKNHRKKVATHNDKAGKSKANEFGFDHRNHRATPTKSTPTKPYIQPAKAPTKKPKQPKKGEFSP